VGGTVTIATRQVQGRRTLAFATFDEMLADAERLVSSPHTRILGNWPLERLLGHLAVVMNSSIDGIGLRLPWYKRLLGRYVVKGRVLRPRPPRSR
jgi:hypothetical protein